MIADLLDAMRQPVITAQDIIDAADRAGRYLHPQYVNLLLATRGNETETDGDGE